MIKRTVSVGKASRISLRLDQLVFWFLEEEEEKRLPVEDVGVFILDHPRITITQAAMNALIGNNAAIMWCDEKHLPHGLVFQMSQHHTFTQKLAAQIRASEPLKKQLWRQNIQAKIANQAAVLQALGKPHERLRSLSTTVRSGDPDNLEGRAAKWYWKELFSELEHFSRDPDGGAPNNLLNYGYAILRGLMARSLVASGCLPAMGIFHRNKYNPFCLADDMMESYRPYVDLLVLDIVREEGEIPEELLKEHKAALLQIPAMDIVINGNKSPLMIGTQRTSASLMRCYEGEARKLVLPAL